MMHKPKNRSEMIVLLLFSLVTSFDPFRFNAILDSIESETEDQFAKDQKG